MIQKKELLTNCLKKLVRIVKLFTRFGAPEKCEHEDEMNTDKYLTICSWVEMVRSKERAKVVLKEFKK